MRDQPRQLRVLSRVERLETKGGDHEIRARSIEIAREHVILDEGDLVGAMGMQPLECAGVHARGNIDGRNRTRRWKPP